MTVSMQSLLALVATSTLGVAQAGGQTSPPQRQVTVAAAADLKFAMDDLVREFAKGHPEVEVRVTYGSSGNFFSQLSNGAPFDLFFSADVDYVRRLAADGPNVLPGSAPKSNTAIVFKLVTEPMFLMLLAAG